MLRNYIGKKTEDIINELFNTIFFASKTDVEFSKNLLLQKKGRGSILAIFYYGRSGSYFFQSFFDKGFPSIITACPESLIHYEQILTYEYLTKISVILSEKQLDPGVMSFEAVKISEEILSLFPKLIYHDDDNPNFPQFKCNKEIFLLILSIQLVNLDKPLNHDAILKSLMIAARISRGENIIARTFDDLVYFWQAHVPHWPSEDGDYRHRKNWVKTTFTSSKLLTVVRFPEKTLDSHLLHHSFESLSPPLHTLFRRLFLHYAAVQSIMPMGLNDEHEKAIRFEDLHLNTEVVIKTVCNWLGCEFNSASLANDFSLKVRNKKITGTRVLSTTDLSANLLNKYDIDKIRILLNQEYREWGYDKYIVDYDKKYTKDLQLDINHTGFFFQYYLSLIGTNNIEDMRNEINLTEILYRNLLDFRKNQQIKIIRLLYDPETLPHQLNNSIY